MQVYQVCVCEYVRHFSCHQKQGKTLLVYKLQQCKNWTQQHRNSSCCTSPEITSPYWKWWKWFPVKHMWMAYFIVHHSVIQCSPVFSLWADANHNDRALQIGLTGMHILDGSVYKQGFGVHAFPLSPLICPLKRLGLD